jgi:hypothetical protein
MTPEEQMALDLVGTFTRRSCGHPRTRRAAIAVKLARRQMVRLRQAFATAPEQLVWLQQIAAGERVPETTEERAALRHALGKVVATIVSKTHPKIGPRRG